MPILGADQKDLGLWKRRYTDVHPDSLDEFYTDNLSYMKQMIVSDECLIVSSKVFSLDCTSSCPYRETLRSNLRDMFEMKFVTF